MEIASVFIDFSYGGLGHALRAQRELSNISINDYYQSFMGDRKEVMPGSYEEKLKNRLIF